MEKREGAGDTGSDEYSTPTTFEFPGPLHLNSQSQTESLEENLQGNEQIIIVGLSKEVPDLSNKVPMININGEVINRINQIFIIQGVRLKVRYCLKVRYSFPINFLSSFF